MTAQTRSAPKPACKDCGSTTRKLIEQGPRTLRCGGCLRARKRRASAAAHGAAKQREFALTPEEYRALLAAQGGVCYLCRVANGKTRRLTIDHDHRCCPAPPICGQCIRGLLCRDCNNYISRRMHDNPAYAMRMVGYLERPPAIATLNEYRARKQADILDDNPFTAMMLGA